MEGRVRRLQRFSFAGDKQEKSRKSHSPTTHMMFWTKTLAGSLSITLKDADCRLTFAYASEIKWLALKITSPSPLWFHPIRLLYRGRSTQAGMEEWSCSGGKRVLDVSNARHACAEARVRPRHSHL